MKFQNSLIILVLLLTPSAWSQELTPAPNSATSAARPTIQAVFRDDVGRARIWVDGREFTGDADHRGRRVTLVPPYNLDYGTHRVQVRADNNQRADWNFTIQRNAGNQNGGWWNGSSSTVTDVQSYGPVPGSVVTVPRPPITAIFNGKVRKVKMTVDGVDVTPSSRISSRQVTWIPGYNLDNGQHNCVVTAVSENGQPVRGTWNFVIR